MGGRAWYDNEDATPGAAHEHRLAAEALKRLRAENRRASGRPYRAASLAEAEHMAPLLEVAGVTPIGVLRMNALTGKHKAGNTARRSVED